MEKMITVIIPVYNSSLYLKACLDSVINQTYTNLQIILVDDGSTDCSGKICDEYQKKDCRIEVIHQTNQGNVRARRNGLDVAKGEYISFIDSDDWVEVFFLEKLQTLMDKYKADMVVSGCLIEDAEKKNKINMLAEGYYDKNRMISEVYPKLFSASSHSKYQFGVLQYLCNKLYKRDIITTCIKNLDERIYDGEDVACIFEACLKANDIVVDNHAMYHYRIHDNSICTSKRDERYFVNAVYLYTYIRKVFEESPYTDIMMPQLIWFINMFINNGMRSVFGYEYVPKYFWTLPAIPHDKKYKICLFGAGNIGQSYFEQLSQIENIEITLWVDSKKNNEIIQGVMIDRPEQIQYVQVDYIVIAVKRENTFGEIKEQLKNLGIEDSKIIFHVPHKIMNGMELKVLQK